MGVERVMAAEKKTVLASKITPAEDMTVSVVKLNVGIQRKMKNPVKKSDLRMGDDGWEDDDGGFTTTTGGGEKKKSGGGGGGGGGIGCFKCGDEEGHMFR